MEHIITQPQRIGDTSYLSADRIDVDDLLSRQMLNERLVARMKEQDKLAVVTPETFRMAVARRPAGSPWPPRGFTDAYLIEKGLMEAGEAPQPPPRVKSTKTKPAARKATIVDRVTITVEAIQVGDYFLQPKKRGNFTFYDAVNADGVLLRDKSFVKVEKGTEFLNTLSTEKAAAATPGASPTAESADGHDLRPRPVDAEG